MPRHHLIGTNHYVPIPLIFLATLRLSASYCRFMVYSSTHKKTVSRERQMQSFLFLKSIAQIAAYVIFATTSQKQFRT